METLSRSRAWLEVHLNALLANYREASSLLKPGVQMICVLKANAYGYGAVRVAQALYGAGAIWAEEIVHVANLVDAACNRRDEKRLRFLREDHARVWRMRNREGGLADSLARLPRF